MSNGYEILYIISSASKEQEVNNIVKTIEDQLKAEKAKILYHKNFPALDIKEKNIATQKRTQENSFNSYVKQKFAYPIKGEVFGYYQLCYFTIKTAELKEIKEFFNLNKQILRFNILKHKNIEKEIQRFLKSDGRQKHNKQATPFIRSIPKYDFSIVKRKTAENKYKHSHQPMIKFKQIKIQEELKKEKVDLEKIDEELDNILKGEGLNIK